MAVGDLEQVSGRIIEVERAPAVPLVVVGDLDAGRLEPLTSVVAIVATGLQALTPRAVVVWVGDRARMLRREFAVEEQQDTAPEPERSPSSQPATAGRPSVWRQTRPTGLSLCAVVIERGFEHPDEI